MFGFIKGLQEKFTGLSRYGKKFQAQDKKKKIVLMIIGVVIIVAISQFTAKEEKKKEKLPVRTQQQVYAQAKEDASKAQAIVVPGTKVNSQDIWMAEGQKKINQTEQVTNQLSNQVSQQKNQDDIRDQQIKDLNAKLDAMTARIAQQGDNTKVNSSASMSAAVIKPQPQIQEIDMDNSDDDGGGSITSPKIKPPVEFHHHEIPHPAEEAALFHRFHHNQRTLFNRLPV
jgi:type II secretory pathway pseudopilin PulG